MWRLNALDVIILQPDFIVLVKIRLGNYLQWFYVGFGSELQSQCQRDFKKHVIRAQTLEVMGYNP